MGFIELLVFGSIASAFERARIQSDYEEYLRRQEAAHQAARMYSGYTITVEFGPRYYQHMHKTRINKRRLKI